MPRISYLISTYCGSKWLDRCLYNLTEQTEQDYEAIVVNSASPENDGEIAQDWAAKDKRVKYIHVPERETYFSSWVRGWKVANSEVVVNKNVDDLLLPKYGERTTYFFENILPYTDPAAVFFYSSLKIIDQNYNPITTSHKQGFDFNRFTHQCESGPVVAWLNSKIFRDLLDWNELAYIGKNFISAADYGLFLYFLSLGFHGYCTPEVLITYMQRPDSIENSNYGGLSTWESLFLIKRYFPDNFKSGSQLAIEHPEWVNNTPPKEAWIQARKEGRKWQ